MPTAERHTPRLDRQPGVNTGYSYRRPLSLRELLPAMGVGIAAGLFAFYVTRLLSQRTPLKVERRPRVRGAEPLTRA
jgi:hypothetical protein